MLFLLVLCVCIYACMCLCDVCLWSVSWVCFIQLVCVCVPVYVSMFRVFGSDDACFEFASVVWCVCVSESGVRM